MLWGSFIVVRVYVLAIAFQLVRDILYEGKKERETEHFERKKKQRTHNNNWS